MDFTSVTRGTLNGGDIGTSFASFPYSNTAAGQLSETRFSAKNSRLGLRMDTDISDTKVMGYIETDFLGNAPTNMNVASNEIRSGCGSFSSMFSVGRGSSSPDRIGACSLPIAREFLPCLAISFFTQDVDVNYQVGLVWERTAQLRLLYHPTSTGRSDSQLKIPTNMSGPPSLLPANFTTHAGR